MEEDNQQITQKPPFPIKTKIAAWWTITLGALSMIIGLVILLWIIIPFFMEDPDLGTGFGALIGILVMIFLISYLTFLTGALLIIGLFLLFFGFFLLKKRMIACWWTVTILLLIGVIFSTGSLLYGTEIEFGWRIPSTASLIFLVLFFIPFIFLLLDRKNFWKIAT